MNDEGDIILADINKIKNDNNIIPTYKNAFNDFIESKEREIKDVLLTKLYFLEKELFKYKQKNSQILSSNSELKKINENNMRIINEQESDLNSYEDKFNNLNTIIKEKEKEINELNIQIKNLENELKIEKEEKEKNDEYNKYKINKIKMQCEEEIKRLNSVNDNLNIELKNIKTNINLIKDKNKEDLELYKEQKNIHELKIKEFQKKINFLRNENKEKNETINEFKINVSKTNNENINL